MTALVADFGTRAFWLGSVCTFVYFLLLAVLVLVWWLSRKEPAERLTKAEREFLAVVKGARR